MILSIMLLITFLQVVLINAEPKTDKNVTCPELSRTRLKELRSIHYETCNMTFNFCFQQIYLTEIVRDEHFEFLFASGCASKKILKPFNLTESQFRRLCQKKGVDRCLHHYNETMYKGTLCCEKNSEQLLSSWLWDVFFGGNEEMTALLENTVSFVRSEKEGKFNDHMDGGMYYIIAPLLVTVIFTALSLLQYYHINDGILT
ncbi:unnamed protein product [Caenorhabditis brenneri]